MANGNKGEGGEMIVPILTITSLVLPRIMEMMNHYKEMSDRSEGGTIELTEEDKTRMKQNLEQLRLPDWDDI